MLMARRSVRRWPRARSWSLSRRLLRGAQVLPPPPPPLWGGGPGLAAAQGGGRGVTRCGAGVLPGVGARAACRASERKQRGAALRRARRGRRRRRQRRRRPRGARRWQRRGGASSACPPCGAPAALRAQGPGGAPGGRLRIASAATGLARRSPRPGAPLARPSLGRSPRPRRRLQAGRQAGGEGGKEGAAAGGGGGGGGDAGKPGRAGGDALWLCCAAVARGPSCSRWARRRRGRKDRQRRPSHDLRPRGPCAGEVGALP